MAIALAVWIVILWAAWGFGGLIYPGDLSGATIEFRVRRVYAGVLTMAAILFGAALFRSLSPVVGLLIVVVGIGLAKADWRSLGALLPRTFVFLVPLSIMVAIREVNLYDTGLYHQQAVSWLAHYGLVRGVALIYFPFGYNSSWFALSAPLNHGVLAGRVGGLAGGLVLAMLFATIAYDAGSKLARLAWAIFASFILVAAVYWNMDTSLSPDPIFWLLPAVVGTAMGDAQEPTAQRIGRATLMAALGCLLKLPAVPVLVYCGAVSGYRMIRDAQSRRRLGVYLALSGCTMALLVCGSMKASGCPFFPSSFGCFASTSDVDHDVAARISEDVRQFAKSGRHWEMAPLAFGSVLASLVAVIIHRKSLLVWHSVGICWAGIGFVLLLAPGTRYALGYFAWLGALAFASIFRSVMEKLEGVRWLAIVRATAVAGTAAALIAVLQRRDATALLYPRRMATSAGDPVHARNRKLDSRGILSLRRQDAGEVSVSMPVGSDQCWNAALPCTPELTSDKIRLRDPARGFSAGFKK